MALPSSRAPCLEVAVAREHDEWGWQEIEAPDASLERIREHLLEVREWSSEMRVPKVERVASAALGLLDGCYASIHGERELIDTMFWSLSLLAVLMDDAADRAGLYPPDAVNEAVRVMLDEIAQVRLLLMPQTTTH